ncbi:MAG: energy transducer TonB [Synergistota bacterium]|nr:energy transducer TonB [Synergistota bacterium]
MRPEDVVKRVKPAYPLLSRRKGEQGEVLLRVFVDESGYVENIRLERSSGHDMLNHSAIKAVQAWSFTPGEARELFVPVQFTLVH